MEYLSNEPDVWTWSTQASSDSTQEQKAEKVDSQLEYPALAAETSCTIGYWGSLGESRVLSTEDGQKYIVCECATVCEERFLVQRLQNMMEYALSQYASESYPFVWTPKYAWFAATPITLPIPSRLPPLLRESLYQELSDSDTDAQPKISFIPVPQPDTVVRHTIALDSNILPLDLHLHIRGHIPGCQFSHCASHVCLCAAELCLYAAETVCSLHSRGFVHREIRTATFMIRDNGDVLMGGMWSTAPPGAQWFTRPEPEEWEMWRAPEARDDMEIDCHADIFSLGLTMVDIVWSVRMYTLRMFDDTDAGKEQRKIRRLSLLREAAFGYALPNDVRTLVASSFADTLDRMLQFSSVDRPDAFEVVTALEQLTGIVD